MKSSIIFVKDFMSNMIGLLVYFKKSFSLFTSMTLILSCKVSIDLPQTLLIINLKKFFTKLLAAFAFFSVLKLIYFFIQSDCLTLALYEFQSVSFLNPNITEDFCNEAHNQFCYLSLELISSHHQLLFHIPVHFFSIF